MYAERCRSLGSCTASTSVIVWPCTVICTCTGPYWLSNSWPVKVRVVVRGAAVVGGVVAGGEVCRVRGGGPLVGGVVLVDGGGAELGGVVCVTGALACAAAAEVAGVV